MSDQVIEYAPGTAIPVHSRAGVAAFACAVLAAVGLILTMILMARPIPGPMGGAIRGAGALFAVILFGLWIAGITLGIKGMRERNRNRALPRAALATCAVPPVLFLLMIILMY